MLAKSGHCLELIKTTKLVNSLESSIFQQQTSTGTRARISHPSYRKWKVDVVALQLLKIPAGIIAIHCSKCICYQNQQSPDPAGGHCRCQVDADPPSQADGAGHKLPLVSGAQGLHIMDQETWRRKLEPS